MGTYVIKWNFENGNKYYIIEFPNGNKYYEIRISKWEHILYYIISKWDLLLHTAIYCYTYQSYQSQYKKCT